MANESSPSWSISRERLIRSLFARFVYVVSVSGDELAGFKKAIDSTKAR